jgi:hypothetical protein
MAADRSANFVIKAKDAATGPLGKVGGAMGKLKSASVTAFKAIGAAAIAAGAALVAFAAQAIMAAAEDEKQTIRLNAALKARGYQMDQLSPKIEEQIKAMARLGFTDDQVRSGLEIGSRFFKNQNNLLRANAVAANIAAATGKDLGTVMLAIGRGAQGTTRGLATLGIEVEKGAKLKDILRAADEKYLGVAEEVANSTSGKFAAAQIRFNEAIEGFGADILPMVTKALTFFIEEVLPKFEQLMKDLGPVVTELVDEYIAPLATSVGELFKVFDNADFSLLDLAFAPIKITLTALKIAIDAIVAGIKFIQGNPVDKAAFKAATEVAGGSSVYGMGGSTGGGGYGAGVTGGYSSSYATITQAQFTIGTKTLNELTYAVNRNMGNTYQAGGTPRTRGR